MKVIFPTPEFEAAFHAQKLVGNSFLSAAFGFWLDDNPELRSPFPDYVREPLIQNTFVAFMHWAFAQDAAHTDEDALSYAFQEIIKAEGMKLVATDDERLSIQHPHFPRIGDRATIPERGAAGTYTVVHRGIVRGEGKPQRLVVRMLNYETMHPLETSFAVEEES